MLTGEQVQRLGTHIAATRPHFDHIVQDVVDRVSAAFPHARAPLTPHTRNDRHHLAAKVGQVTKNLGELQSLRPYLTSLGAELSDRGFDVASAAPVLSRAILEAVRGATDSDWSPTLEADWRQLIGDCVSTMARGSARRLGAQRAAA